MTEADILAAMDRDAELDRLIEAGVPEEREPFQPKVKPPKAKPVPARIGRYDEPLTPSEAALAKSLLADVQKDEVKLTPAEQLAEAEEAFNRGVKDCELNEEDMTIQIAKIEELKLLVENTPTDQEKKAGDNILKRGKVLKFLVQQAQRNHMGDEGVIKILMASIAATNSAKSRGIFPDINGPPGGGKSDAALATIHLVPKDWKSITSISAKALYYDDTMQDGMVVYSDDIEYSKELTATLKRSKGDFQHKQMHTVVNTVDGARVTEKKEMPCRIAWWLSSVESAADDQLKDRDYALDIDDTPKHAQEVTDFINTQRGSEDIPYDVDWRIRTARYIISQIKEHEIFKVKADFAKYVTWHLVKDHRSQNKFWDLVDAITILNYQQRQIDERGWLHATKEDFEEAKACFVVRRISHETKLTDAQVKLIQKVAALEGKEGATQGMLVDELKKSQQAVSKALTSILATPYLTCEKGAFGEKHYHTTGLGLKCAYSNAKEIVTLQNEVAA